MSVSVLVDYRASLGPVKDQGRRPTCLSHAATAAHEGARQKQDPLSPEYLHWFAASSPGGGAKVDAVAGALRTRGQPLEAACPYRVADPPAGWSPPTAPVFRRDSEERPAEPDEVAALLHRGITPVLVVTLPEPFFQPADPWIVPAAGKLRGTHAVVGVGVGAAGGARLVLVRNSWGTEWGDQGHVWLDDRFLTRHLLRVLVLTHEVASA